MLGEYAYIGTNSGSAMHAFYHGNMGQRDTGFCSAHLSHGLVEVVGYGAQRSRALYSVVEQRGW